MRGARVERALGRRLDVLGRVEVGLADLEVHYLLALPFERASAREHLERGFRPQSCHPLGHVHGAHYILVEFIEIAAGDFLMGDASGAPCERPVHRVHVDAFAMAVTPVTNAAYARYLAATGAAPPPYWGRERFDGAEQPVVGLSWDEASAFAAWADARLPTEAEWERAARGGVEHGRLPWAGVAAPRRFTEPPRVRATPPNPFGLFDLSGVCHEWCADWYADDYYAHSPAANPRGPANGTRRVSRGGAWRHADPWSAVGHRSSLPPALRYTDYGVRLARDVR